MMNLFQTTTHFSNANFLADLGAVIFVFTSTGGDGSGDDKCWQFSESLAA